MKDKNKTSIQTYVQLFLNNVELNIAVTKDLKREEERLKNIGYIQITEVGINEEKCFWDNIKFFFNLSFKEYKKECKEDLDNGGYDAKQTYKDIKRLLKRAHKMKIIDIE